MIETAVEHQKYLSAPICAFPTSGSRLDKSEVHSHEVLDMHPRARVRSVPCIKRRADSLDLFPENREVDAVRFTRPSSRSVYVRRTHDGRLEFVTVVCGGCLDDLVDVAMEFWIRAGCDLVDVVDVGPYLGVELS